MEKIAIVTDAWHPQINGVVTTLNQTVSNLTNLGYMVEMVTPLGFRSVPCPSYPEISLALATSRAVGKRLFAFEPNYVHIATEGPLGWAARSVCLKNNFSFSSSYHTRFPEYVRMRCPIPISCAYSVVRRFHGGATRTMVATRALMEELSGRGFDNLVHWSRGVNSDLFKPGAKLSSGVNRPLFMYVGRVAVEKNIETFLRLDLPGTKYVVGDGPALPDLKEKFPAVVFTGYQKDQALADYVAGADVFVFPSKTDTFGVVLLEAMASGVPVAAYPVSGPLETVVNGVNGYLDSDLRTAALKALEVAPQSCRQYALTKTWAACTSQFVNNLAPNIRPLGCA